MRMRILLAALLILGFASPSDAKEGYFGIQIIRESNDFRFPILSARRDTIVSTRINRLLQLSELYRLANAPYSPRIFEQSKANDGSIYGGKVSLVSTIFANNNRVISVGFDESACGATCGYWSRYYTFNSGNGDRLELKDLFTSAGYESFHQELLKRRTAKYQKEVREKVEQQYQEAYMETVGCFKNDDLTDFHIRNRSIVIDGYNCLIKGQKFDGLDMNVAMPASVFARHLNRYGRIVFGLARGNVSEFRSRNLPQLFEGSVNGKYPIVMVLTRVLDTSFEGFYAYLKHGEGIALKGRKDGVDFKFDEYILSADVVDGPRGGIRKAIVSGHVSGRMNGLSFEGFWTDPSQTKKLNFRAAIK